MKKTTIKIYNINVKNEKSELTMSSAKMKMICGGFLAVLKVWTVETSNPEMSRVTVDICNFMMLPREV